MFKSKKENIELKKILNQKSKIVIVTHWSPDGDAMGSSLGLYHYLKKKKHQVTVVTPNDYPSFLSWLPGNNTVVNFSENITLAQKKVKEAQLIFCLDFNSLKRIESLGDHVGASGAIKVMIDHHAQPDSFARFMFHDIKSSSTCELVYNFIESLGDKKLIDKKIAACLYTGIMTDTGSFRFASASYKTYQTAAELIKIGADHVAIHQAIKDDNTEDKLKLIGYSLSNKMVVLKNNNAGYIALSSKELDQYHYKKGDTEGLVNYILSIKGIQLAAFFTERDGKIKISFRSKGNFDVNLFARKHFNGGGHKNAAGGIQDISLDEVVKKFLKILPAYKKQLI